MSPQETEKAKAPEKPAPNTDNKEHIEKKVDAEIQKKTGKKPEGAPPTKDEKDKKATKGAEPGATQPPKTQNKSKPAS